MKYRPEIDGLRAIAVVPVILFHAGFSSISGGFLGVDVFFVISGYLITTIIVKDLEAGNFTITGFYDRRARRILPALYFVMLCSLPFAWLLIFPLDFKEFAASIVAVTLFVSNILFWHQSDYFDTAAELKPLLHTWSLAVEEQYYVFFPAAMMLLWRLGRRNVIAVLAIVAVASLVFSEFASRTYPSFNYYWAPTRVWELLAGALCSFVAINPQFRRDLILSAAGLGSVLLAIFWFDERTRIPSLYALLPVTGTCLVILFATAGTPVQRLLSSRILVTTGLISYSAYLWHQPIFAFTRMWLLGKPSLILMTVLCLAIWPIAYLSWRYIESPFRNRKAVSSRQIFGFGLGSAAFFVGLGTIGQLGDGFPWRFNLPVHIEKSFDKAKGADTCFDVENIHTSESWLCSMGKQGGPPSFLAFGDSHVLTLFEVFGKAAADAGVTGFFTGASGCTPLLGIHALRPDQTEKNCHDLNERVFAFVKENHIPKLVLVARWQYYTTGGYEGDSLSFIGLSENDRPDKGVSRRAFESGVRETARRYGEIGTKVYVFAEVPEQRIHPGKIFRRAFVLGNSEDVLHMLSVDTADHVALQAYTASVFNQQNGVTYVSFDDTVCSEGKCPAGDLSGSYYYDLNHLSAYGAERLKARISAVLRD
jgi:peptidoglycan/LPS O-acetylase OafA/YrhL